MADVDMQECTLSNVDDMMQSTMVQRQIEGASYMTVLPKIVNSSLVEFEINSPEYFLEQNKTGTKMGQTWQLRIMLVQLTILQLVCSQLLK